LMEMVAGGHDVWHNGDGYKRDDVRDEDMVLGRLIDFELVTMG